MVRSPGFGSINSDSTPYSDSLSLWLRHSRLNLPLPISRRLILQQARGQTLNRPPTACRLTVSCSISLPSRGSFHLSLAVLSAIGHAGVFSLTRWSSLIHSGFHVPRTTRDSASIFPLSATGLSPPMVQYSVASPSFQIPYRCPSTPRIKTLGLGYFPFRSPLLGESLLLSLPPATKMFQFAGFALAGLYIQPAVLRVAPFGNPRIDACFQLPGAYRR